MKVKCLKVWKIQKMLATLTIYAKKGKIEKGLKEKFYFVLEDGYNSNRK